MEKGIINILEVADASKLTLVAGKKVFKDGKVDGADFAHVVDLVKEYDVFAAAVADIGEVVPEAKDLDEQELVVLGAKLLEVIRAYKEA